MTRPKHPSSVAIAAAFAFSGARAFAQEAPDEVDPDRVPAPPKVRPDERELSKQAQNPIAKLYNLPVEQQLNLATGPAHDQTQYVTNLQPVVPVKAGDDWNIITRAIMPFIDQPVSSGGRVSGLGDLELSIFATSSLPSKLTWGAGPAGFFPTATDAALGTAKWSAGPTAVAVATPGHWVMGVLASQVWSYAGVSDRTDVSQALVQPFINYNLRYGWALSTSPIMTHDWKRGSDGWLIPVGGALSKTITIADVGVRAVAGMYWNVVRPNDGPEAQVRLQLAMLLPQ